MSQATAQKRLQSKEKTIQIRIDADLKKELELIFTPKLQLQVEHFGKMAATSGCIKVVEKCIE